MSLVYDITFLSLHLSSIETSFYDWKERTKARRVVVLVCVCVFEGGDGGLAEWPFPLPPVGSVVFSLQCRSYHEFDLPQPFLYPEIHNTTRHMHFIR